MKIKTTGLAQYLPDGEAHIKTMVIGGPGVGKTRWSSFWPTPLYANCEAGLASVADRKIPYVDINGSEDMLELLKWLKRHPDAKKFGTLVVDTLDSFQRKVKDEWLQANAQAEAFSGYDAWGYLDAKMQMLMTRLLSLDMHVIVLVHYKEKSVTEKVGSNTIEKQVFTLQLQGDIKDTAFNDFDLVGWMDTYYAHDGEGDERKRTQKRGITFKPSEKRPYLKDRLHITPEWLDVTFDESDYTNLFSLFMEKIDQLSDSEDVGEVVAMPDEEIDASDVRQPMKGGPVAPQDPRPQPLDKLKVPELKELAEKEGIKLKTGLLKGQIIAVIEENRKQRAESPDVESPEPEAESPKPETEASEASEDEAPADEGTDDSSDSTPVEDEEGDADDGEVPPEASDEADDDAAKADELIKEELGGEVISESGPDDDESTPEPEPETPKEAPKADESGATCEWEEGGEVCGKSLKGESADLLKLAYIKTRKHICNDHYRVAKQQMKK